jgi:hypothetical protein
VIAIHDPSLSSTETLLCFHSTSQHQAAVAVEVTRRHDVTARRVRGDRGLEGPTSAPSRTLMVPSLLVLRRSSLPSVLKSATATDDGPRRPEDSERSRSRRRRRT